MNWGIFLSVCTILFSSPSIAQVSAEWTDSPSGLSWIREQGLIVGAVAYKEFLVTSGSGDIDVMATLDVTGNSLTAEMSVEQGNTYNAELQLDLSGNRSATSGEGCLTVTFESDAFVAPGSHTYFAAFVFPGSYTCPENITISSVQPPPALTNEYGVNGLFVDAGSGGNGFDFNVHELGMTIFYYGHTSGGNRLWLISQLFTDGLEFGTSYELDMFEVLIGTFGNTADPETLWGTLTLIFSDCNTATATLDGADGVVEFNLARLAGHHGSGCN